MEIFKEPNLESSGDRLLFLLLSPMAVDPLEAASGSLISIQQTLSHMKVTQVASLTSFVNIFILTQCRIKSDCVVI